MLRTGSPYPLKILALLLLTVALSITRARADELTDGTVVIPRSGRELVSQPSPAAAELCRHVDHSINYSTGSVSLTFPLYTYECGGITVPVSISYQTGGIKAGSQPGALGVGWELNCGGYVSRSVVGMPDDATTVDFDVSRISDLSFLKEAHANNADALYDRYRYTAGGYSGSFIIRADGTVTQLPATDVDIRRTGAGFDITTPDGVLYRFDIPEKLYYSYQPSAFSNAYVPPDYSCDNMWRLSRIVSPSGADSVTISYTSIPRLTVSTSQSTSAVSWRNTDVARWTDPDPAKVSSMAVHSYSDRHRVASVSGRGGTLTFSYDATYAERCTGITVRNCLGVPVRQVAFSPGRTLASYRITDSANNLIDGADFGYYPAVGSDSGKDFFGYRNGGGDKSAAGYDPDSLGIDNEPYDGALDRLLRPSWKRQPVLGYAVSESLRSVITAAGTETTFHYGLNDGGYFLTYGRVSPGLRLEMETVTDRNTGNVRTRALAYRSPVTTVDFSDLQPEDFVSVSGSYSGTDALRYATYSTGATLSASCRLQGASIEDARVYYGNVTETINGTGLEAPIITDYEYDTSQVCSGLVPHGNRWSDNDLGVAGTLGSGDCLSFASNDPVPQWVYQRLLAVNVARGHFPEVFGERAPLRSVTRWRAQSSGARSVWKRTVYHNRLAITPYINLGFYIENVLRSCGGTVSGSNISAVEGMDFRSADDFNRFAITARATKVYVDSVYETEYDERGTPHTVVRRTGYNNRGLRWMTGTEALGTVTGPDGAESPLFRITYLPDPEISGTRDADNDLPRTYMVSCGDEWVRADYVYSSTSDTPLMRALSGNGLLTLPVETFITTGRGVGYSGPAISEKLTYAAHPVSGELCLASDVVRARADTSWHTVDSVVACSHDRYGNPLSSVRNGGATVHYGWTHQGTSLASVQSAGLGTGYTWIPLVGCTSVTSPSGLVTSYTYSGERLAGVSMDGSDVREYTYMVHGGASGGGRNYVNERTIADAAASRAVNRRSFLDAFGNMTGAVVADNSMGSAVATLSVRDAVGRLVRDYAPRQATDPSAVPSAPNPGGDPAPYSAVTYSGSGDTRPLSATIPGEEYSGHPSRMRYLFSTGHTGGAEGALSCRRYRPGTGSGSVTLSDYYPEGALSVEVATDGDGRSALAFRDFRGRLILTRSLSDTGARPENAESGHWTDTYYVYDDADNLVFVVTPPAAPSMSATGVTWSTSDGVSAPGAQCYSYTYDGAMRLRSSKAPGADPTIYVYDATGAPILTQNGGQRSRGVCSFALPDSLGRVALTGECVYTEDLVNEVESAHAVATRDNGPSCINGYAPGVALGRYDLLTATYYDDYSFLSLDCFSRLSGKLADSPLPQHKETPGGLPTGSWRAVLGKATLTSATSIVPGYADGRFQFPDSVVIADQGYLQSTQTALCYDSRDRLAATVTADHLGGLCTSVTAYDNADMPLTVDYHRAPLSESQSAESHTLTYTYDGLGRVSAMRLSRGDSVYDLRSNSYDSSGRLSFSGYGNGCGIGLTYRPSGAPESLSATGADGTVTYSQTLRYASGDTPSYSGKIGGMDWRGADNVTRRYGFSYDGLGRLVSGAYTEPYGRTSAVTGTPSYTASYTYGPDSRPLTVVRQGVRSVSFSGTAATPSFGEVDNLTLTYTGPLLTRVRDDAGDVVYAGATDFDDGADTEVEYTYDADGRLISDSNKGVTSISYNAIGLPAEIAFSDGSCILNYYSADGTLLQRVSNEHIRTQLSLSLASVSLPAVSLPTTGTVVNHIGALTYRNDSLWRVDTPAGYIASGRMHYYVRDHQGNVRQVTDSDGNVEQDNHYYPYGMLMGESGDILATARSGRGALTQSDVNPYLYGGKEYLATAGANLLDFSARTYDPSILLFHTPDPLRDKYIPFHSYLYCLGDPIMFTDPSGLDPWDLGGLWNRHSMTTRLFGAVRAAYGVLEAGAGATVSWTGAGAIVGCVALFHGCDNIYAGVNQMITGVETSTLTNHTLQKAGLSRQTADNIDAGVSTLLSAGTSSISNTAKSAVTVSASASASASRAVSQESSIDQIRKIVTKSTQKAAARTDLGTGAGRGSRIHKIVADEVKGTTVNGYTVDAEVSYIDGSIVKYGATGSARLDIGIYDSSDKLIHVFDIKTGNATLKTPQIQKIHKHTSTNVPVEEIKVK